MTQERLEAALRSNLALARLEETLIRRARELYALGYTPKKLSPSQMAAVEELIVLTETHNKALARTEDFLRDQLTRLRARVERGAKPTSWLSPPKKGAETESLGEELMLWLQEERYLASQETQDLDRLAALQRFWGRFHGLYRYHHETSEEMCLEGPEQEGERSGA